MRKTLALLAATLAIALAGCSDAPSPTPPAGSGGTGGTGGSGGDAPGGSGGEPSPQVGSITIEVEGCDFDCTRLTEGQTAQLIATVRSPEGEVLSDVPVEWSSSDPEVGSVVDGLVTALQVGLFDIEVTAAGQTGVLNFRVFQVEHIRLQTELGVHGSIAVVPGKTITVIAGTFSGGFTPMPIYGVPVDWEIATEGVVEFVEETFVPDTSSGSEDGTPAGEFPALVFRTLAPGRTTIVASIARETKRLEESIEVLVLDSTPAPAQAFFDELGDGGENSACAISAGTGYGWGSNWMGQLGIGTQSVETEPQRMGGGIEFSRLALGSYHGCGLDRGGAAWCWGANFNGQLGIGTDAGESYTPVAVMGGGTFVSIGVGSHSCAIDGEDTGWCWGPNHAGQLGTGHTEPVLQPVRVTGGHRFRLIAPGSTTTCALDVGGKAWCWGTHQSSLGLGNGYADQPGGAPHRSPMPVHGDRVYKALSVATIHTCAVDEAGSAWCWGSNWNGQLGVLSTGHDDHRWEPLRVEGIPALSSVVVGAGHSCGLAVDGSAWCWGANHNGQLGIGDQDPHVGPVEVLGGLSFRQLEAGGSRTCGLTTDGGAYCWGSTASGALGNGVDGGAHPIPTPVHAPNVTALQN